MSISAITDARLNRSERLSSGSSLSPTVCSGLMYAGVPLVNPGTWVRKRLVSARAMPKSMILTTPWGVSMKLAGLMSRWTRFIGRPWSPVAEWA